MLFVSMGVSVDGYIADRTGAFDWGAPGDDLFGFHLERVRRLDAILLGRRLYETMRVWETDPAMRHGEAEAAFADTWVALPKVVFSRTLERVEGNARLATGALAEEVGRLASGGAAELEIGGAMLAGQAIEAGLVDEFRIFRYPIIVGGGAPLLPHVADPIRLELAESRVFSGGVVYEHYRRVS